MTWGRMRMLAAMLGLVSVLLAGVLLVLLSDADRRGQASSAGEMVGRSFVDWGEPDANDTSRLHREVAEAARAEVLAFLTVDHRDMQPHIDAVLAGATGEFKEQYAEKAPELIEVSERNESISTGTIVALGVGDLDSDSATVFIAANSEVSNVSTEGTPQPRYYRLQLDLVKEDGVWLTSQVQFVG